MNAQTGFQAASRRTVIRARSSVIILSCVVLVSACAVQTEMPAELDASIQWYTGAAGRIDDDRARSLLEAAIATGDTLAGMWEARVYSTGRMGFEQDLPRARTIGTQLIAEVETLAAANNPEAMFLMGTAFAEGLGKVVNPETAVRWYEQAATQGHMLAQHNLGNAYASGTGVSASDAQAVYWWRRAAESGDAIPQYRLGQAYEHGNGVEPDSAQAIRWYRDAASRGYRPAADALHRMESMH